MNDFNIGDVVQLKSSGPGMTVIKKYEKFNITNNNF